MAIYLFLILKVRKNYFLSRITHFIRSFNHVAMERDDFYLVKMIFAS